MYVQYSSPDGTVVLRTTNRIGFFGSAPGQSIAPGAFQGSTVQVNAAGTKYSGSFPNVKYISSTQCDFGTGTKLLTQIPFQACTLRIRLQSGSLSAVRLSNVKLGVSGSLKTGAPRWADVYGVEKGKTTWTHMSGSNFSMPLTLTPHTSSGSYVHDYYVALSMSPAQLYNIGASLFLKLDWY